MVDSTNMTLFLAFTAPLVIIVAARKTYCSSTWGEGELLLVVSEPGTRLVEIMKSGGVVKAYMRMGLVAVISHVKLRCVPLPSTLQL